MFSGSILSWHRQYHYTTNRPNNDKLHLLLQNVNYVYVPHLFSRDISTNTYSLPARHPSYVDYTNPIALVFDWHLYSHTIQQPTRTAISLWHSASRKMSDLAPQYLNYLCKSPEYVPLPAFSSR